MKLLNRTKRTTLCDSVEIALSIPQRVKGLIGKENPSGLVLKTRWGVHTFGMKFPIDCVIMDSSWKVRFLRENIVPCRVILWNPFWMNVAELPAGSVRNSKTTVGNILELG